jgi:oligosaccharide repeat unit polymerase
MSVLIVPALVIVFIVFPLVGAMRNSSGDNRVSSESIVNAWWAMDNPVIVSFSEVGSSMGAVSHTLDLVPTVRPFDAGASYLYALLMIMPNLAWDVHPTSAHGTLSLWLVKTVAPATAAIGGGLGYSFIAEAYANFGWIGVPAVMLILGWGAGKLSSIVRMRRDPAVLALAAALLSFVLIYARSETSDLVRNASWYGFVPYLLTKLISGVRS